MRRVLLVVGMVLATVVPVSAQQALVALEDELAEMLRDKPDAFYEAATELIIGYGSSGRIDAEGIERMIALRRASLRAGHIRRLLVADLDNDGSVTRAEVGTVLPTLSATVRSRLVHAHRAADQNMDGIVRPDELRDTAQAMARKTASDRSFLKYRYVLMADLDNDGWVTLDEVSEMMAQVLPES
ncbi:EF hand [Falsiruegeria litorea R37]|uniref:EF hand n=1 Tax=Falsiruegeria litorea R37 TaxID=1200284 RepID=A0A1Y5TAQ2_9RHOB|nr:hypothetical protein [Falsiruegeria litorea]SLN57768.1 EF hand [Falsiruegeria litorea R37]